MKTWLKLKLLWLLPILSVMTGCATVSTELKPISDYCRIAKPITFDSKVDSHETIAQITYHNNQWVCVCEHDCPNK